VLAIFLGKGPFSKLLILIFFLSFFFDERAANSSRLSLVCVCVCVCVCRMCVREREKQREKQREEGGEGREKTRERECVGERVGMTMKELPRLVVTTGTRGHSLKHFYAYTTVFEASLHIRH